MRFFTLLTMKRRILNVAVIVLIIICTVGFFMNTHEVLKTNLFTVQNICDSYYSPHSYIVDKYYEKRKNWITSNLGAILFKNVDREVFRHVRRENKTYVVLIWKHWDWLQNRHLYRFHKKRGNPDPLEGCSVRNCIFSGDDTILPTADAVVVHMQKGLLPEKTHRNPRQRWIFLNDESPSHTYTLAKKKPLLESMVGMFNWTMTYRSDSDIPVPYGRTVPLPTPRIPDQVYSTQAIADLVPYWKNKTSDVLVAILISNCGVKDRMQFLSELRKHIEVDVHGGCADKIKNSCPGHFRADCPKINKYLFYLVLENASCRQYMTEKLYYHAYSKGAIPVIRGPLLEDCEKLLPPNSYLHVDSFDSVENLTNHIKQIGQNKTRALDFHQWRNNFQVENEHGYFGTKSVHTCRICEALNYNDGEVSIYDLDNLELFQKEKLTCRQPTMFVKNKTGTYLDVHRLN